MARPSLQEENHPLMLAGDTSTGYCTVALCSCDTSARICTPLSTVGLDSRRLHSERLLDAVQWVLTSAEKTFSDLSCLAMTTGPGSFTGLRVGLAFWKGLALALQLPLVSVPTLDALTGLNAFPEGTMVPLLDARMKEVFGAVYRYERGVRSKIHEDQAASVEHFLSIAQQQKGPYLFVGDGALRYRDAIVTALPDAMIAPLHCSLPRAEAVASEALELWLNQDNHDPAAAAPRYHRISQAEQARAQRDAAEKNPASSGSAHE